MYRVPTNQEKSRRTRRLACATGHNAAFGSVPPPAYARPSAGRLKTAPTKAGRTGRWREFSTGETEKWHFFLALGRVGKVLFAYALGLFCRHNNRTKTGCASASGKHATRRAVGIRVRHREHRPSAEFTRGERECVGHETQEGSMYRVPKNPTWRDKTRRRIREKSRRTRGLALRYRGQPKREPT
jgi:hypothetical protein